MITKACIDKIFDAVDIVEVIGEFVNLKKRGANYVGLSPFANEKSPSFVVSPVKQIFKDFSSGKGGSAVTFLMEHEKFSYPEALRWLAAKYGIEIEEEFQKEEDPQRDERESLFIVNKYAAEFFHRNLLQREEGKNIGLSYFKERGFREETLETFQLGYGIDAWSDFTDAAIKDGYQEEFLVSLGLTIKRDNGKSFDRYKGRVIFPIQDLTGRVIGFGGRILNAGVKAAKYVNSPESMIYHKSHTLYGIFQAKNKIRGEDNCFLAEGYTDVISLHQSGIENVVASSGTSLTVEQVKLIGRYTENVTVLFDGDAAGIKASLRGTDMILEAGLNVKILLFPDGHDPDSFVRSVGGAAFKEYVATNRQDFILFKTNLLLKDTEDDPVRRAEVIRDILQSIAKIPDSIKASVFIAQTARILNMEERILLAEYNKIRLQAIQIRDKQERRDVEKEARNGIQPGPTQPRNSDDEYPIEAILGQMPGEHHAPIQTSDNEDAQEREVARLLVSYGGEIWEEEATVAQVLLAALDDIEFQHKTYHTVFLEAAFKQHEEESLTERYFIDHPSSEIRDFAADALTSRYTLSKNWEEMHEIFVPEEKSILKKAVLDAIYYLKWHKVIRLLKEKSEKLKENLSPEEMDAVFDELEQLTEVKKMLAEQLGAVSFR